MSGSRASNSSDTGDRCDHWRQRVAIASGHSLHSVPPRDGRMQRRSRRLGLHAGGMGALSQSLAAACESYGVDIFLDTPVDHVAVKGGRAVGVVIRGGREYASKLVVSSADPNVTFNGLVAENVLPASFVRNIRRINYDSASVKINLALSELPDFTACPGVIAGPQHRGTIHICPDLQFIESAYADSLMAARAGPQFWNVRFQRGRSDSRPGG